MGSTFDGEVTGDRHCEVAGHAHDIEAGQKHELQEQHFVNGQGLDLHFKNFQNDFAKNKMVT